MLHFRQPPTTTGFLIWQVLNRIENPAITVVPDFKSGTAGKVNLICRMLSSAN
jgi:hypothetical protein